MDQFVNNAEWCAMVLVTYTVRASSVLFCVFRPCFEWKNNLSIVCCFFCPLSSPSSSFVLTDSMHHVKSEHCKNDDEDDDDLTDDDRKAEQQHMMNHPNLNHLSHHHNHGPYQHHHHHAAMMNAYPHSAAIKEEMLSNSKNQTSSDCGVPLPASKPKIWSLADTAACKTPPPISQHGAWMPTNPYQSGPGAAAAAAAHMTHSHPATHNPHQPGIGAMMMMNAGAGGNGHPPPNHIAGMNMTGGNMNGYVPHFGNYPASSLRSGGLQPF